MLINEKIKVKLGTKNLKHYLEKGYKLPIKENGKFKNGGEFEIDSCDININSPIKIKCQCNGCGIELHVSAYNHNFDTNIDYCVDCGRKKSKETIQRKIENNEYTGKYCGFTKENIYKDVDLYIKENGTIKGYTRHDTKNRIKTLGLDLKEIVEDLGYDWTIVGRYNRTYAFNNKEELKSHVQKIIDILGYFPTTIQIQNFGIWPRTYHKFYNSYNDLRYDMGYSDKIYDILGYSCKSSYEKMFTDYLIQNNIKFQREENPFKENNYRDDFTLFKKNGKKLYVEIWGLLKNNPAGDIEKTYKKTYEIKTSLYGKYNLDLVSFYITDFETLKYFEKMFLSKINICDLQTEKYSENILHNTNSDNIKIYVEKYFPGTQYFPSIGELRDKGLNSFVKLIYKNYKSIDVLAKELNMPTKREWCKKNHINIHTMQPNRLQIKIA